jgi:exodeoxyribonuclease VII large subunit
MILPDVQEILYTLDEVMQRYSQAIEHTVHQKQQSLRHLEEMLLRSSPVRRLSESQNAFSRLEDEFNRVIKYKIESFETQLPTVQKSFHQNVIFMLQQKEQQLDHLIKRTEMSDPRSQCKKGWAQISVKGRSVQLADLRENERFILEDASVKVEAICLHKKMIEND